MATYTVSQYKVDIEVSKLYEDTSVDSRVLIGKVTEGGAPGSGDLAFTIDGQPAFTDATDANASLKWEIDVQGTSTYNLYIKRLAGPALHAGYFRGVTASFPDFQNTSGNAITVELDADMILGRVDVVDALASLTTINDEGTVDGHYATVDIPHVSDTGEGAPALTADLFAPGGTFASASIAGYAVESDGAFHTDFATITVGGIAQSSTLEVVFHEEDSDAFTDYASQGVLTATAADGVVTLRMSASTREQLNWALYQCGQDAQNVYRRVQVNILEWSTSNPDTRTLLSSDATYIRIRNKRVDASVQTLSTAAQVTANAKYQLNITDDRIPDGQITAFHVGYAATLQVGSFQGAGAGSNVALIAATDGNFSYSVSGQTISIAYDASAVTDVGMIYGTSITYSVDGNTVTQDFSTTPILYAFQSALVTAAGDNSNVAYDTPIYSSSTGDVFLVQNVAFGAQGVDGLQDALAVTGTMASIVAGDSFSVSAVTDRDTTHTNWVNNAAEVRTDFTAPAIRKTFSLVKGGTQLVNRGPDHHALAYTATFGIAYDSNGQVLHFNVPEQWNGAAVNLAGYKVVVNGVSFTVGAGETAAGFIARIAPSIPGSIAYGTRLYIPTPGSGVTVTAANGGAQDVWVAGYPLWIRTPPLASYAINNDPTPTGAQLQDNSSGDNNLIFVPDLDLLSNDQVNNASIDVWNNIQVPAGATLQQNEDGDFGFFDILGDPNAGTGRLSVPETQNLRNKTSTPAYTSMFVATGTAVTSHLLFIREFGVDHAFAVVYNNAPAYPMVSDAPTNALGHIGHLQRVNAYEYLFTTQDTTAGYHATSSNVVAEVPLVADGANTVAVSSNVYTDFLRNKAGRVSLPDDIQAEYRLRVLYAPVDPAQPVLTVASSIAADGFKVFKTDSNPSGLASVGDYVIGHDGSAYIGTPERVTAIDAVNNTITIVRQVPEAWRVAGVSLRKVRVWTYGNSNAGLRQAFQLVDAADTVVSTGLAVQAGTGGFRLDASAYVLTTQVYVSSVAANGTGHNLTLSAMPVDVAPGFVLRDTANREYVVSAVSGSVLTVEAGMATPSAGTAYVGIAVRDLALFEPQGHVYQGNSDYFARSISSVSGDTINMSNAAGMTNGQVVTPGTGPKDAFVVLSVSGAAVRLAPFNHSKAVTDVFSAGNSIMVLAGPGSSALPSATFTAMLEIVDASDADAVIVRHHDAADSVDADHDVYYEANPRLGAPAFETAVYFPPSMDVVEAYASGSGTLLDSYVHEGGVAIAYADTLQVDPKTQLQTLRAVHGFQDASMSIAAAATAGDVSYYRFDDSTTQAPSTYGSASLAGAAFSGTNSTRIFHYTVSPGSALTGPQSRPSPFQPASVSMTFMGYDYTVQHAFTQDWYRYIPAEIESVTIDTAGTVVGSKRGMTLSEYKAARMTVRVTDGIGTMNVMISEGGYTVPTNVQTVTAKARGSDADAHVTEFEIGYTNVNIAGASSVAAAYTGIGALNTDDAMHIFASHANGLQYALEQNGDTTVPDPSDGDGSLFPVVVFDDVSINSIAIIEDGQSVVLGTDVSSKALHLRTDQTNTQCWSVKLQGGVFHDGANFGYDEAAASGRWGNVGFNAAGNPGSHLKLTYPLGDGSVRVSTGASLPADEATIADASFNAQDVAGHTVANIALGTFYFFSTPNLNLVSATSPDSNAIDHNNIVLKITQTAGSQQQMNLYTTVSYGHPLVDESSASGDALTESWSLTITEDTGRAGSIVASADEFTFVAGTNGGVDTWHYVLLSDNTDLRHNDVLRFAFTRAATTLASVVPVTENVADHYVYNGTFTRTAGAQLWDVASIPIEYNGSSVLAYVWDNVSYPTQQVGSVASLTSTTYGSMVSWPADTDTSKVPTNFVEPDGLNTYLSGQTSVTFYDASGVTPGAAADLDTSIIGQSIALDRDAVAGLPRYFDVAVVPANAQASPVTGVTLNVGGYNSSNEAIVRVGGSGANYDASGASQTDVSMSIRVNTSSYPAEGEYYLLVGPRNFLTESNVVVAWRKMYIRAPVHLVGLQREVGPASTTRSFFNYHNFADGKATVAAAAIKNDADAHEDNLSVQVMASDLRFANDVGGSPVSYSSAQGAKLAFRIFYAHVAPSNGTFTMPAWDGMGSAVNWKEMTDAIADRVNDDVMTYSGAYYGSTVPSSDAAVFEVRGLPERVYIGEEDSQALSNLGISSTNAAIKRVVYMVCVASQRSGVAGDISWTDATPYVMFSMASNRPENPTGSVDRSGITSRQASLTVTTDDGSVTEPRYWNNLVASGAIVGQTLFQNVATVSFGSTLRGENKTFNVLQKSYASALDADLANIAYFTPLQESSEVFAQAQGEGKTLKLTGTVVNKNTITDEVGSDGIVLFNGRFFRVKARIDPVNGNVALINSSTAGSNTAQVYVLPGRRTDLYAGQLITVGGSSYRIMLLAPHTTDQTTGGGAQNTYGDIASVAAVADAAGQFTVLVIESGEELHGQAPNGAGATLTNVSDDFQVIAVSPGTDLSAMEPQDEVTIDTSSGGFNSSTVAVAGVNTHFVLLNGTGLTQGDTVSLYQNTLEVLPSVQTISTMRHDFQYMGANWTPATASLPTSFYYIEHVASGTVIASGATGTIANMGGGFNEFYAYLENPWTGTQQEFSDLVTATLAAATTSVGTTVFDNQILTNQANQIIGYHFRVGTSDQANQYFIWDNTTVNCIYGAGVNVGVAPGSSAAALGLPALADVAAPVYQDRIQFASAPNLHRGSLLCFNPTSSACSNNLYMVRHIDGATVYVHREIRQVDVPGTGLTFSAHNDTALDETTLNLYYTTELWQRLGYEAGSFLGNQQVYVKYYDMDAVDIFYSFMSRAGADILGTQTVGEISPEALSAGHPERINSTLLTLTNEY